MSSSRASSVASAVFVISGTWLTAVRPALADPEFRVAAQTFGGRVQPPVSDVEQTAASNYSFAEPAFPQNMKRGDAFARSGPGRVGANIHVITHYPNAIPSLGPNLGGTNAGADASFVLDDLIIVLESDPSQIGSVQGSFSVELSGSLSANAVAISGMGSAEAFARVNFEASLQFPNAIIIPGVFQPEPGIDHYFLHGNLQRSSFSRAPSAIGENQETGGGLLAGGFDGDEVFTSGVAALPVGMPFGIDVRLSLFSQVTAERSGEPAISEFRHAEGQAGFGNTLGFPLNVDVFNLPPGYTAYSESGLIVDNRFIPEPTAAVLLLIALAATPLLERRCGPGAKGAVSARHLDGRGSP
jgi:hypothetical protein